MLFLLLLLHCERPLHILDTRSLSHIQFANIVSHSVVCFFHFLNSVLWCMQVFNFDEVHLPVFFFVACAVSVISKNLAKSKMKMYLHVF